MKSISHQNSSDAPRIVHNTVDCRGLWHSGRTLLTANNGQFTKKVHKYPCLIIQLHSCGISRMERQIDVMWFISRLER